MRREFTCVYVLVQRQFKLMEITKELVTCNIDRNNIYMKDNNFKKTLLNKI